MRACARVCVCVCVCVCACVCVCVCVFCLRCCVSAFLPAGEEGQSTAIGGLFWDNYKGHTYVGTLDGLYQHTLIATGTRLRPVEATFFCHILSTKPAKNIGV